MTGYGLDTIGYAFVAVALLVPMVDVLTRVLKFLLAPITPDILEMPLVYVMLVSISSAICWQGHFDLLTLLGFNWWQHPWLGWVITGAIIAGGTTLLKKQFNMMGLMPSIFGGVASMFGYSSNRGIDTTVSPTPEELEQHD